MSPTRLRPDAFLSTPEVCERSGATYRQIDYWDLKGYLRPAVPAVGGSGSRRRYTGEQVRIAKALVRLSAMGVQGDLLGRIADRLPACRGRVMFNEWGSVVPPAMHGEVEFGWVVTV